KLAGPIESVKVVQTPTIVFDVPALSLARNSENEPSGYCGDEEIENQKQEYVKGIQTLGAITGMLAFIYEKSIVEYRQHIAKLAVEIARKILVQKVKEGDYQIESIVAEALKNAPARQEIVIRLNPKDLTRYQQIQQALEGQAGSAAPDGIKFAADPSVGLAQCIVETPKGKVESLIDEHLEQVERALVKAVV
ncbi:MAG: FliH/SctL family protein, partial [Sedimentisphaerales bacterium]